MRNVIDQRGVRKLVRDHGLAPELLRHAENAARIAYTDAPYQTGAYRESIFAELGRHAWVVAYVGVEDRKGVFIERGSRDKHGGWRARHILENAARKAGMRVVRVDSRGIAAI